MKMKVNLTLPFIHMRCQSYNKTMVIIGNHIYLIMKIKVDINEFLKYILLNKTNIHFMSMKSVGVIMQSLDFVPCNVSIF